MNFLLSYPRSGNHLVRFFIELLSELPTYGVKTNINDVFIHLNKFEEEIPFNINEYKFFVTVLFSKVISDKAIISKKKS